MQEYDIIIVGGGIAGLYSALKLCKTNKILIIEKNNYLGGRISTFNECINKQNITYEEGAGRLSDIHTRVMELIKNLKLSSKLVKIPNKKTHILGPNTYQDILNNHKANEDLYKLRTNEKLSIEFLINIVLDRSKKYSKDSLINMSFFNLIQLELSSDASQFIYDAFGYISELININAYDGVRMFKEDFSQNNQFYILNGGLSQIIDNIVKKLISSKNVDILLEHNFIDYIHDEDSRTIVEMAGLFSKEKVMCKRLILALPQKPLVKLDSFKKCPRIMKYLRSVKSHPLCRVYAIFPKNIYGKIWFENLPKITTDNVLQYIIPINYKKGLIMISYSDNIYADFWKNVTKDDLLIKVVMDNLNRLFPDVNIPEPTYIRSHYWSEGCHFSKPGVDSVSVRNLLIKPFKSKEVYICGEAYSSRQAWIEGSLETADKVIDIIDKSNNQTQTAGSLSIDINSLKKISINELKKHNTPNDGWIAIKGLVLDVTKWINIHPGGRNAVIRGLGKDYTEEWSKIKSHNVSIMQKYFPKMVIGRL